MPDRPSVLRALRDFVCRRLLEEPDCDLPPTAALTGEGYIDSIKLAELRTFLEREYGLTLDMVDLTDLADDGRDTLENLAELVLERT